ncbi:MAG: peptidoglycan N-acetylmuramoylhydrolase, partial [Arcobacter sp.]
MKNILFILFVLFFVTACSSKKELIEKSEIKKETAIEEKEQINRMELVSFPQIEGFFEDDLDYALEVFKKDCKRSKIYEIFEEVFKKDEYEKYVIKYFITKYQPNKIKYSKYIDE